MVAIIGRGARITCAFFALEVIMPKRTSGKGKGGKKTKC